MREVAWSTDALDDFDLQIAYIATENPHAAATVAARIQEAANSLGFMPTGRQGRVPGTYEKVVKRTPHILAYMIDDDGAGERVLIVRVIHTSRNWQAATWPE